MGVLKRLKKAIEDDPQTYVVIVGKEVVFECRSMCEGFAFIAGRGAGVLAAVMDRNYRLGGYSAASGQ